MLPLPPPPPSAYKGFSMPMFRDWVPRRIQPWIYVICVFCIQFSGGMYLGALNDIQGSTNFMIEDLLMLLYVNLSGMAVYFPMLFRMKFRFTNRQLLIGSALIIGICNLITMHSTCMPLLLVVCFISGMAKLQGTFEHMSNIQLWITPRRDFAVFFPVLHIVLLTAIEGSAFLAAWMGYHFTWRMMHVTIVGAMCVVIMVQLFLCRPFCPYPGRLSLRGIDVGSGLLISLLMLIVSYVMVYGDYLMWMENSSLRLLVGVSFILAGVILHRLRRVVNPYVDLRIFRQPGVVPVLFIITVSEFLLGLEHTMEEILCAEVLRLEEHTKEELFLWTLPGVYAGVGICLLWLRVLRWKVWRLLAMGFGFILAYTLMFYFTLDMQVGMEHFRLPIMCRGAACAILSASLMWALDESLQDLEQFFMGLFVFNILHMYLAGAAGYAIYTTWFSHFLSEDLSYYGQYLTMTSLNSQDMTGVMARFIPSMMNVAIKQIYGISIWISGGMTLFFMLVSIRFFRTNVRKMPLWPVYAIEYIGKKSWRRRL